MTRTGKLHIDTTAFLWLALVLFIILILAFLLPLTPQDYWWYLRVGRDTLAGGAVPKLDTFTFTQAGSAVDYQSWGAAVLFWLIYKLGGLPLTMLLRGTLLALAYWLAWLACRRAGAAPLSAAAVLLAAVLTSSNNWSVRPQLFCYPLFALALYILYRWQTGDKKGLWVLPIISLLWVNLHGSFVMLVLLYGAALVFGRGSRRSLLATTAGILLATLINPRGLGAWSYVSNSLTAASSQQFSGEWLPPVNSGWQMNIFFMWLLGFPFLAALSENKLNRLEWVWFLGFGLLALLGERYVIWFVFILAVLTARLFSEWEKKYIRIREPRLPQFNMALGIIFILIPLMFLPGFRQKWWAQSPSITDNTPVAAVDWLAGHADLQGPLWSEIGFSSYLEFRLPERPTWIDTRFEVFPVEQWQQYKNITNARFDWENLLDQAGVNLLLVSQQNQGALVAVADASPHWCALYRDEVAVLYRRGGCEGDQ